MGWRRRRAAIYERIGRTGVSFGGSGTNCRVPALGGQVLSQVSARRSVAIMII